MAVAAICSQRRRAFLATALAAALVGMDLHAATYWTAGVGHWSDGSNWNAGLPSSTVDAVIDNGGAAQVLLPDAQSRNLSLYYGSLEILQGATLLSKRASLGKTDSTIASVLVDGADSQWTLMTPGLGSALEIGAFGRGDLTISNGGQVSVQGGFGVTMGYGSQGNGSATVTGSGSSLTTGYLDIGQSSGSVAALTIADGATVNSSSPTLAVFSRSSGTVLVTGQNSTWQAGVLVVGRLGQGSVTITDGGLVSSSSAYMGQYGGKGTVVVVGEDSKWSLTNSLSVGAQGGGVLEINAGAQVEVATRPMSHRAPKERSPFRMAR